MRTVLLALSLVAFSSTARAAPAIVRVTARCVRFSPPREHFTWPRVLKATRGVEFDVEVSDTRLVAEMLEHDVAMSLYVGDVPVDDAELIGPRTVRYVSYHPGVLPRGGALSLRWPDGRDVAVPSSFAFEGCARR